MGVALRLVVLPSSAKASSVGAKTVKGPPALRVSNRPTFSVMDSRVLNLPTKWVV